MNTNFEKVGNGLVVHGDAFELELSNIIDQAFRPDEHWIAAFPLLICDPPYGRIIKEDWDRAMYTAWMYHLVRFATPSATICMWGGIGRRNDRPFLKFASTVEEEFPEWSISNWITWKKKRAYGVARNYLFTREEMLVLTRGEPTFNIPLLDKMRGYDGYNVRYPAKSPFLRRTNVWTDVTEILARKIHPTQKPDKLYEIIINTHSKPGDVVYDPCAGSCVTMRAAHAQQRRFCVVEKELLHLQAAGLFLDPTR